MSAQWFNPMTDTPEGRLLKDVQELLKEVKNKDKADLNNDGKLSPYEKKRGQAIEASMARQGYKSDRGQRPAPKMPAPKGNKNKIDKTTEILIEMGIVKNVECSDCMEKNMTCHRCATVKKASMDEKDRYCQKNFGRKYSKCTPQQKAQCDKACGKSSEVKKYSQEPSVENLFPRFQNVDGGTPVNAHGFTTRGTYPATNDGPKKSIVSETAKMPAFAKTEYTPKGSSLHMHYNDAGGTRATPNVDSIEQHLASLTKHAGRHNLGMIGEIEGLLKQVKDRMKDPSN